MARVTHVKKAQQRYATVPVRDAEGNVVRTPVMGRNGEQKKSKRGLTFMTKTVADKTKPLPLLVCDHCRKDIEIGTAYKHISPKSGPYGGQQRNRHESCPTWQVWDYSSSLSARLAQVSHDFSEAISGVESEDDVTTALTDAAEAVREIANEKHESASNIEEGFGHSTSASEELEQVADDLESWADDIESADVPSLDDHECEECEEGKAKCEPCDGTGQVKDEDGEDKDCDECSGDGTVECTADGCSEGKNVDAWREAVMDEITIVDESPV